MTQSHCIQNLFNIKDENIEIKDKVVEEKKGNIIHKVIFGTLTTQPSHCSHCGHINESQADIVKNCSYSSDILLTTINDGQPVTLRLKKQRFFCKHCQRTFNAETSIVTANCYISNALKNAITFALSETIAMTLIGKQHNVSVSTVIRLLEERGKALLPKFNYLPQYLSFDEFKSVKNVSGAMSFIFIDPVNHRLIDIVENRQKSELIHYFMRFSYQSRQAVKIVTIDMYSPYIEVIRACFPNAKILFDRFHVIQHLNLAINSVRIQLMNQIRYQSPRDYRKLKQLWKLPLKNEWELDFKNLYTHRLFDGLVSEQMIVDYLTNLSPELSRTYTYVNRLKYSIYTHDIQAFKDLLIEVKKYTFPRRVRTIFQTLERYHEGICAALTYTLSNGPIEGMNNKTKLIKRTGYGYRRFDHLRIRIIMASRLVCNDFQPRPLTFSEAA
ncbi:ISL3 family transposase [Aerococcus sp. JJEM-2022a]|nr:ISL3 family transposase [Aerococcus loyolae]MCY3029010.1 ISL3 family transposase [Aerococcus loyolae]